jgi:energy-coupling factor transporter ATP-binding protein EcfA2
MAYISTNSVLRAKRLQSLCLEENLSALVFILGIDSRRNRLDEQMYYWLFKGTSGEETLSSVSLPLTSEEIAWIVTPTSYYIYIGSACNSITETQALYQQILEISASWPGITITTVTADEITDSELAESAKLLWFNRTMSKLIGPVGMCSSHIEQWPLVQGYAIDLFGLGFFSMSHPCRDISSLISPLFFEFDDACLLAIINEHIPRLYGVFQQTIEFINKKNYSAGRGELTEDNINECLTLPFEYAAIKSKRNYATKPYGKLWTYDSNGKCSSAHHFTCTGVCGITGVLCARTWFFIPCGGAKEFLSKNEDNDLYGLIGVYKSIIKAVRIAITTESDNKKAKDRIMFELYNDKVLMSYNHILQAVRNAQIQFSSYDADGNAVEYSEALPLHSVLFKVANIRSKDFGNLGEMVFGESYTNRHDRVTVLTQNIEDIVIWESHTKKPYQCPYGERLSVLDHIELYVEEYGLFEGSLIVYEKGWSFRSPHLGQLDYSIEEFFKIEQHTSDAISFFTETLQIVLKVPNRSSHVLSSIWEIEQTDLAPPQFPIKNPVYLPLISKKNVEITSKSIEIYLVIGIAGCGKTKLAKEISKALKLDCVIPDLINSCHFNPEYWKEAILTIDKPCLVVLPSYCPPIKFISLLPDHISIKHIISKVSAKNIYLNDRKEYIPGLIHSIQSCNVLIFEDTEKTADLLKIITLMNPLIEIIKISGSINPQQARNISLINKEIPDQHPYVTIHSLQSVFIKIHLPLVEFKLKQRLANSEISDEGTLGKRIAWSNDMEIVRIKGYVLVHNKDQAIYEVSGTPKYFASSQSDTDCPGILFIGRNLSLPKLYEFILDCRSHVSLIPLKTRKLLTDSEVDEVESQITENSEYIFDGSHYVDDMGKRYKRHPDLELALEDYIQHENDRIGKINRAIEKEASSIRKANLSAVITQVFE